MARGRPRVWFAGGGTGGHVFPALVVAERLKGERPDVWIGFLGGRRGLERRLVPAAGFPLRTLPMTGLKGGGIGRAVSAAALAAAAVARCFARFGASRPSLVVGVGGYASGPAVLAARLLGVSTMVLEQNHFPGATNRWLAPWVDRVCVPSDAARDRLGGRGVVTGNPIRSEFASIGDPPGVSPPSVLVFGGSRGARSINRSMCAALPKLGSLPDPPYVVHQTGPDDETEVREAYAHSYRVGFHEVHAFLEDMPARFAAADLIVSRAGATTLAELAAAGRPAVLVPYPHAADDHQRHNAETVADAGGAVVILDRDLDGESLSDVLASLLSDRERRRSMATAQRELARPDAARRIVEIMRELLPGPARPAATEGGA